jgi:hypothetical protein
MHVAGNHTGANSHGGVLGGIALTMNIALVDEVRRGNKSTPDAAQIQDVHEPVLLSFQEWECVFEDGLFTTPFENNLANPFVRKEPSDDPWELVCAIFQEHCCIHHIDTIVGVTCQL